MAELAIERVGKHTFVARNDRGATVRIGRADTPGAFSPGELLHIATAGCSAVTVEELVVRRAGEDAPFTATTTPHRAEGTREYQEIEVTLQVDLSTLDDENRARAVQAMRTAIERQCTVSRTVERGARVVLHFATEGPPAS
jgi:uncharacterized OsmC-like protein